MGPIRPIPSFTKTRLITAGLRHYWRAHAALALAAAVGVAVLTGSLLVGDSVRGSLREHALSRLGDVDQALITADFFRDQLGASVPGAASLIMSTGSATHAESGARASRVQALGIDRAFWKMMRDQNAWNGIGEDEAVVNGALARQLNAREGDEILVRVQKPSAVPRETFLGEREETIATIRLKIRKILNENADFSLAPSQAEPLNVFMRRDLLARRIEQTGRANVILAAKGNDPQKEIDRAAELDDLGIKFISNAQTMSGGYVSVESRKIFLPDSVVKMTTASAAALKTRALPTLTYLANALVVGDRMTPYSTVAAIDDLKLGPNEIALNAWTADDLQARIGDELRLAYFQPTAGNYAETTATLRVARIIPMTSPLVHRGLTPDFPGIAEAETLGDWNPPFPMNMKLIRDKDEKYWDDYRAAPKAFVSLETGKKLWANRYGEFTSIRVEATSETMLRNAMRERLDPEKNGLKFEPVRRRAIASSQGASDFGGLFIGFSFFLLVSAAMLIHALFSLGVQSRSREFGILSATGFAPALIRRLMLGEGAIVAAIGAIIGLFLGLAYAAILIYGLRTWWSGAVGAPFLRLHAQPASLAIGLGAGWVIAMLSIAIAARGLAKQGIRRLLAGRPVDDSLGSKHSRIGAILAIVLFAAGFALAFTAPQQSAEQQAALFFGAGATLLLASLIWLRGTLRKAPRPLGPERLTIARLGILAAHRRPGRSMLVIALMACATFMIVAIGAQRQAPADSTEKHSGTGGFALIAESSLPIYGSLDPRVLEAGGMRTGVRAWPIRLEAGDDPSCLNLYRAARPRIAGVSDAFMARGGFEFAQTLTKETRKNAWPLLYHQFPDGAIPAIGDANTVTWLLHSGVGKDVMVDGHRLRFVALLKGSIFQSELLIAEDHFLRIFPHTAGYRLFAIEWPEDYFRFHSAREPHDIVYEKTLAANLETHYSDFGFDAVPTTERLATLLSVENTYLSIFMALGGLGLLLGTLGMALALLRNLIERRHELALLRAVGFSFGQLLWLSVSENLALIAAGMMLGTATALVAVLPASIARSTPLPSLDLALVLVIVAAFGTVSIVAATAAALRSPAIKVLKED